MQIDDTKARSVADVITKPGGMPQAETPFTRTKPRRLKRALVWVHRMLGHADTILGSLAKAIPQVDALIGSKQTLEKTSGEFASELPDDA